MKKILAVMDFTKNQPSIIENAIALGLEHDAKIILGYIEPPKKQFRVYDVFVPNNLKGRSKQMNEELFAMSRIARRINAAGLKVDILVIEGEQIQALIDKVKFYNVDVLLIGDTSRSWLGSQLVSGIWTELLAKISIPVIVFPTYSSFFKKKTRKAILQKELAAV